MHSDLEKLLRNLISGTGEERRTAAANLANMAQRAGREVSSPPLQQAERLFAVLTAALEDTKLSVRRAAAEALAAVGGSRAVEPLRELLERPHEAARRAVIDALVTVGTAEAIGALIAALSHPNPGVRLLVLRAIKDILQSSRYSLSRGSAWFQEEPTLLVCSAVSARLDDEDALLRKEAATVLESMQAQRDTWDERLAEQDQFDDNGGDERRAPALLLPDRPSYLTLSVRRLELQTDREATEATSVAPPGRHADLTLFDDDEPATRVQNGHALQADRWYRLEVAVRSKLTGLPRADASNKPIVEPKQPTDIMLLVTAQGDGFEVEEPVSDLLLPPVGDTPTPATFRIRPIRKTVAVSDRAELRVRLFYDFNLIETLLLAAEVVGPFEAQDQPQLGLRDPIGVRQERRETDYVDLQDVEPRAMHIDVTSQGNGFQFTFTFANDRKRQFELTAPLRVPREELEDKLVTIRELWYDIALGKTLSERVDGDKDEFAKQLKKLAQAGRDLWAMIFRRASKGALFKIGKWLERHPISPNGKVQVSVAPGAAHFVFPWALLYDRPLPKSRHQLPSPDGFWGVRYDIEQRLPGVRAVPDTPVAVKGALKLEVLQWEQFRNIRLQNELLATLREKGAERIAISAPPITDAEMAYDRLGDSDAHILYFYTHGYTRHRKTDVGTGKDLAIFLSRYDKLPADSPSRQTYRLLYDSIKTEQFELDRSWIELSYGKLYLDELYEDIDALASRPVVILNMCESAQATPSLSDSFIHFFLDRGATTVLGTECPMTVEFAHPLSERLLNDVLSGSSIGVALLAARRHFMTLHNPLGLAYTLFGSTTAHFVPAAIPRAPDVNG